MARASCTSSDSKMCCFDVHKCKKKSEREKEIKTRRHPRSHSGLLPVKHTASGSTGKKNSGHKVLFFVFIDSFIFISALVIYSTSRLLLVSFRDGGALKNMSADWPRHVSLLSCSAAS